MKKHTISNQSGNSSIRVNGETLLFEENLSGTSKGFDINKWEAYASRSSPAWAKYLTSTSDYTHVADDNLVLRMDKKLRVMTFRTIQGVYIH